MSEIPLSVVPRQQTQRITDYRDEALSRDGFVVAWPPQRYWKNAESQFVDQSPPLHLYFHIPFCLQRCRYCFFKIGILSENSYAVRERYVDALCQEIAQVSEQQGIRGRRVQSIYFGGGTPSVLQPEQLARIKASIEQHFILDDPEFVFEIEPVTFNDRLIDGLSELGVNRMSFGIQSFDDRVVALTGRHDTEAKNCAAIERALASGAVVNIDLLSGLEGETMDSWQHSVNRAIELGVHAVTVYKLELYSNAHYMDDIRAGALDLPDDEQEMRFARWGIDRLRDQGYAPSTYFTFTKGGAFPQRHIISRWRGEDLYGFGASAFGTLGGVARQNLSEIDEYLTCVEKGASPVQRVMQLSSADHMLRDVVMGMKTTRIDLAQYQQRHGLNLAWALQEDIKVLEQKGLLNHTANAIELSAEGVIYGDYCGRYLGAALRRVMTGNSRPIKA
jgi:oxygen-independent coproporphyrinogen-3 oxidase